MKKKTKCRAISKSYSAVLMFCCGILFIFILYIFATSVFVEEPGHGAFIVEGEGKKVQPVKLPYNEYVIQNVKGKDNITVINQQDIGASIRLKNATQGDTIIILNKETKKVVRTWKIK